MSRRTATAALSCALLAACLLAAGCKPRPPSINTAVPGTGTAAPAPQPATAPPAFSGIHYQCQDGTTLVAHDGDSGIDLDWPDGRHVTLPRAESASKGGGDVYVGQSASVEREGTRLQVHEDGKPARDCQASGT